MRLQSVPRRRGELADATQSRITLVLAPQSGALSFRRMSCFSCENLWQCAEGGGIVQWLWRAPYHELGTPVETSIL